MLFGMQYLSPMGYVFVWMFLALSFIGFMFFGNKILNSIKKFEINRKRFYSISLTLVLFGLFSAYMLGGFLMFLATMAFYN